MKQWSEEALHLLTEVLPNVAQELRGAMANVYAAAERLAPAEARERDAALDKNAAVFLQSYYRMHRLIGNLSDAQKLTDDGALPLSNDDVVGVCRAVCERAEGLFDLEGVGLTFESDRANCVIALNAPLLERLLLNLLSNALKFTPRGGSVAVRVRCGERAVRLSVADTGCGIAPELLDGVFDRFLAPQHAEGGRHGMGLGLALCRRIAEGHGGTIVVESAAGAGATFTVSLPRTRVQTVTLRAPAFSYAGGFNETLLELSDALGTAAFTHRYLD